MAEIGEGETPREERGDDERGNLSSMIVLVILIVLSTIFSLCSYVCVFFFFKQVTEKHLVLKVEVADAKR